MKTGIIMILLAAFFGLLTVLGMSSEKAGQAEEIKTLRSNIDYYKERYIEPELFSSYASLISLTPDDFALYEEYIEQLEKYSRVSEMMNAYYTAYQMKPEDETYIAKMIDMYIGNGKFREAFEKIYEARETVKNKEEIEKRYKQIRGTFKSLTGSFETIEDWYDGYAKIKLDDKYGFADSNGDTVVAARYSDIGCVNVELGYISAFDRDRFVFLDINGYRKLVPDELYSYIGIVKSGAINVCLDGTWGYCGTNLAPTLMEYQYTGPFGGGLSAAQKDNKWYLISLSTLAAINTNGYEDIITNDCGVCVGNDIVFVKENGKFNMLNTKGEKIGTLSFDDARYFSGEAAAVKVGEKWGFVNKDGSWLIEPKFADAKSFGAYYAAVSDGKNWGFIDNAGEYVIEPQFSAANSFNINGVASVEANGKWKFIQLNEFNKD